MEINQIKEKDENKKEIKTVAKRNILTSGLISTYPFISSSIFDENGIYIGDNMYNNSLVLIDRYDTNKYKNANMCIFGTSGAGLHKINYFAQRASWDRTICN